MGLYLNVSNSLESLSANLAENLEQQGNSVFQPHLIVTQTEGMNNWLKLQIAAQLGIAANCRFLKPNDLIHQLYYVLGGRYTETLSSQNLAWLLFMLLGEKEFEKRFPFTAAYFNNSGPEKDLKRIALAEKIADLFDQYQIYRPEMIEEWNRQSFEEAGKDEWQQYLWLKAKKVSGNTLPDKTIIGHHILDALKNEDYQSLLSSRMPAVHLFGLSIITDYHVQILYELSSFIDIHFHLINPSPVVYWFEDRSEKQLALLRRKGRMHTGGGITGNVLLTNWGKVVQDTFGLLFKHEEFINAYDDKNIVPPQRDSLLHKIQHDIFDNATDNRNKLTAGDIRDGSVTINTCYTIAREVEVLYNYLVHLVDQKKESLSPRDIVVMVSDIDAYAPYIKAIFNNAPYPFRYTIADESYAENDNLFNALYVILGMNESNFRAEDVLQLLDLSYIRNRFDINDVSLVRSVVDEANIRFGMQGRQEDDTFLVSWRYGIRRILFGICMSGGEEYGTGPDSFFPIDVLEGSEAADLIRFSHFVEMLIQMIEERKQDRTIAEWVNYVERVLRNLVYEPDEDTDEDYTTLMEQLSEYNVLNEYVTDKVSFEVFGHNFLQNLTRTTRSGLFVNGGITFCSLIPMRSIPFKVVALMGLDYDKFPRREKPAGFNLMEKERKRGDRSIKENDKHLFLETILSARKYLYISYVGQNAKDNTQMPPSALVDELIDYIESGTADPASVSNYLVTQQPLHGFSKKYNTTNRQLYSYLHGAAAHGMDITTVDKEPDPLSFEEIRLEDVIRFFKNPFKAYYNKVLGIYYNDDQVLLSDTELFTLDSLQKWKLKNELLPLDPEGINKLKIQLLKKGRLPLRSMADVVLHETEKDVQPVRDLYKKLTKEMEAETVPVELAIDGSVLKGTIDCVFDGRLVMVSWSKKETKYLIEGYILYLAGVAAGKITGLSFLSGAKRKEIFEALPLTKKEAVKRLKPIISIYKKGFEAIAPFYPDFGIEPGEVDGLDTENFLRIVQRTLDNGYYRSDDPYIMPEYEQGFFRQPGIVEAYKNICSNLVRPLVEIFPGYYVK